GRARPVGSDEHHGCDTRQRTGWLLRTPGGFVGRTVESKLGDIVSVTDFDADPTGVSDSSTAFNAAVNASLSVYIPAGTYRLASGGVTLRPGSTIKGAGMGAAT